jgi:hypothetical protein
MFVSLDQFTDKNFSHKSNAMFVSLEQFTDKNFSHKSNAMFVSLEQFTVKVFKNSGLNHIGSVMVSMVAWSMVDHGFTVESNQRKLLKRYKHGIGLVTEVFVSKLFKRYKHGIGLVTEVFVIIN